MPGEAEQLAQLAPLITNVLGRLKPLWDQPVVRLPYNFPNAVSATIAAGTTNQPIPLTDFINALEFPFEIKRIKFSQDPSHTFRDWRVQISDQTFNQPFQKNSVMVATLIEDNTGAWNQDFPWVVRPKGGGLLVLVDNLDTVNAINVDINFQGNLLIPR